MNSGKSNANMGDSFNCTAVITIDCGAANGVASDQAGIPSANSEGNQRQGKDDAW